MNLIQCIEHGGVLFDGPLVAQFTSLFKLFSVGIAECGVLVTVEQALLSLVSLVEDRVKLCFLVLHSLFFRVLLFLDLFLLFSLLRCPALDEINV